MNNLREFSFSLYTPRFHTEDIDGMMEYNFRIYSLTKFSQEFGLNALYNNDLYNCGCSQLTADIKEIRAMSIQINSIPAS